MFLAVTAAQEAHLSIRPCIRNLVYLWHLLTTVGDFWQLLATWQPLTKLWQLLATFGIFLATFCNFWPLLATFGNLWQLLPLFGNLWQLLATFWQLLAIFGNF